LRGKILYHSTLGEIEHLVDDLRITAFDPTGTGWKQAQHCDAEHDARRLPAAQRTFSG
jgi:hypothetical protein